MKLTINGMTDPHTHLRDFVWVNKGTFHSETRAAIAGGYTAVFDMPNTPPETTTREAFAAKLNKLSKAAHCDFGIYAGASQGDNTSEYGAMGDACGLKIFCNATTGDLLIEDNTERAKHVRAWETGGVISVHAEGRTVLEILEIVRETRKPVHFLHISTRNEINYLREAKEEGLPVTVGVCPHHLYLTENDLPSLGPLGMMKPELKKPSDRDALWTALAAGVVDVVESDHAPHTLEEKENDDGRPVYGVPGLETTLPLLLLAVHEGRLTEAQVVALVAENPRRIFGVPARADTYTVVDTEFERTINNAALLTDCGWSPFDGMAVYGQVEEVWIRGTQVYDGEQILVEPGFGANLYGEGFGK